MNLAELELAPDRLHLFVFGPGYGESILVRVPPDYWIAIDSLRCQTHGRDSNPALELLEAHGATLAAIALTHPHRDHARGLVDLLERRRASAPVGCSELIIEEQREWRSAPDAGRVLDAGSVSAGLNMIDHLWRTEPESRWPLVEGSTCRVGAATIEVLSPEPGRRPRRGDLNRISSAMLLNWKGCRLLLGADLTVPGWRVLAKRPRATALAGTQALKAAHHGASNAQHPVAVGLPPPRGRLCLVTPFNRGSHLPSYEDGDGVDRLLRAHHEVCVTAVAPPARGKSTRRAAMRPRQAHFGELTLAYEPAPPQPAAAWAASAFDAAGFQVGIWHGEAAGTVVA